MENKTENTALPLYKVLEGQRTKGIWDINPPYQYQNRRSITVIGEKTTVLEDYTDNIKQAEANAAFTVLAVNNLSEIADNLARIIDRIEESNLQDNFPSAYKRAKEALNKIS